MRPHARWPVPAAIVGALLAGAALWAARALPTAPVAVWGAIGLAGCLLLFCGLTELLPVRDSARREREREDHDERGAMIRDKARARAGDVLAAGHYPKLSLQADACLRCGHCEARCPFHVKQESRMEELAAYFQGQL